MIVFPKLPRGSYSLGYLSNGVQQQGAFGGPSKLINRLGDRYAMTVNSLRLRGDQGRGLVAKLTAGRSDKVRVPVYQPPFEGHPGAPRVAGAHNAQTTTLTIKNLTVGFNVKAGLFLTIIAANGKRYLHQIVSDDAVVGGGGTAVVTVSPMIRVALTDNAQIEMAEPTIEGFLNGQSNEWTLDYMRTIGVSFTVTEAE